MGSTHTTHISLPPSLSVPTLSRCYKLPTRAPTRGRTLGPCVRRPRYDKMHIQYSNSASAAVRASSKSVPHCIDAFLEILGFFPLCAAWLMSCHGGHKDAVVACEQSKSVEFMCPCSAGDPEYKAETAIAIASAVASTPAGCSSSHRVIFALRSWTRQSSVCVVSTFAAPRSIGAICA